MAPDPVVQQMEGGGLHTISSQQSGILLQSTVKQMGAKSRCFTKVLQLEVHATLL